jgi:DNA-binding NarL/FixJ family response regulator
MSKMKKTRLAIIEPSPVIRQGIKALLNSNAPELIVAKEYADFQAFQENRHTATFDIILINPSTINLYKQFNVRNSFSDYPETALVAILYGYVDAAALNSFDGTLNIYDDALKIAAKLRKIAKEFDGQQNSGSDNIDLSDREKEILVAVAKGMTNKEIADKHCISVHTVISHRKNIIRKTGIKTISGLTIYAIFNNLISQEELGG